MFNIEHFTLFGILFCLSFALATKPQKSYDRNFWGATAFFIIAYTIIVGLRDGWGGDYVNYEFSYNMLEYDYTKDYDIAYWKMYEWEKALGLPFAGSVLISTLLIVISYFYIVKAMKGDKYMLMCFLPATLLITTYAMRQFHAIAYINIAIALILFNDNLIKKRKWAIITSALLVLLAYHTHSASLAYAIPFAIFLFYRNPIHIPYKISIVVFLCTIVFASIITPIFNNIFLSFFEGLTMNDHLQNYVDKADGIIFGEDSIEDNMFAYGGIFQIVHYAGQICLLYVTARALSIKPNKNVTYIYNIVVIAILIQQIFSNQEIMRRLIDPIALLYFIPLGYAINILMEYRKLRFKGYDLYLLCMGIALFRVYYQMLSFLTDFRLAGFVWD